MVNGRYHPLIFPSLRQTGMVTVTAMVLFSHIKRNCCRRQQRELGQRIVLLSVGSSHRLLMLLSNRIHTRYTNSSPIVRKVRLSAGTTPKSLADTTSAPKPKSSSKKSATPASAASVKKRKIADLEKDVRNHIQRNNPSEHLRLQSYVVNH